MLVHVLDRGRDDPASLRLLDLELGEELGAHGHAVVPDTSRGIDLHVELTAAHGNHSVGHRSAFRRSAVSVEALDNPMRRCPNETSVDVCPPGGAGMGGASSAPGRRVPSELRETSEEVAQMDIHAGSG